MFNCKICIEKDKRIEALCKANEKLQEHIKDLYDRLMAFNKDAFTYYKAETKSGKPLFPHGVDAKGRIINYEGTDPTETNEEILRSMGEDNINVEEPEEATPAKV